MAAGADMAKVFVESSPLSISADLGKIAGWMRATHAKLLVVDPLMAYLGQKTDAYKDQDIRGLMAPLGKLSSDLGFAVLLIRHLVKPGAHPQAPIYRGGGSIGIIAAARSALAVSKCKEDPSIRILSSVKCNLSRHPEALRFRLTGDENNGHIQWLDSFGYVAPKEPENAVVDL
jgi:hypothetical protein